MNDTFNMSRLGCLIDRHYAMYRRHYLTALLIPAVLPWLLVGFMLLGSARAMCIRDRIWNTGPDSILS